MSSSRHLKALAFSLALLGLGIVLYQIFVLKTPLSDRALENLWTIDARISFDVRNSKPVELQFYLPPREWGFDISDELFVANGYGQTVFDSGDNRYVLWTARKVSGKQPLFYRFNASRSPTRLAEPPGETWRTPIPVQGTEKMAIDALIEDIRQKSADTLSFITTAIGKINDVQDGNVKLLLGPDPSWEKKIRVLEVLLSQAHIPVQMAHMLKLSDSGSYTLETWMRSYIEVTKRSESAWYYFTAETSSQGLPEDRILWWVGDDALVTSASAIKPQVDISVVRSELPARSLGRIAGAQDDFSLYSLPLSTQHAYRLMLIIPFGVFIILLIRNIIGLETLGTFTPVLIALAFRETGLPSGILFFTFIMFLGLLVRAYLEHLKLQMLPRLSVVLTFVVVMIVATSMLCHKLGISKGMAVTLFPMVILTMSIERLSIIWEERGGEKSFRITVSTLIAASCVYLVLNLDFLGYFVFTFPAVLLIVAALLLALGRYSGYRLTELFRFRALASKG